MKKQKNWLIHLILILGAITMVIPFLWMLISSGMTLEESTRIPIVLWPEKFQFKNYTDVWNLLPFPAFYWNTFVMVVGRVIGSVLFSAMAAYACARLNFPGKNLFFMMVLVQMMIPGSIFLTPQYLLAQKLGILNTQWALIMPGIVSAFGTFLLRQFFMGLPAELEEAAYMDGANIYTIFFKIMLPLVRSGLVALAIFTALFAFKDLMWPLIANTSLNQMTLSAGVANLNAQYSNNFPQQMAGALYAIWPMVVLFIVFQRKFIEGIVTTGGK
ncbi:TPA: carbohydrate ABC transporter permease [Streptococcus suis]